MIEKNPFVAWASCPCNVRLFCFLQIVLISLSASVSWSSDFAAIPASQWNYEKAAHLLDRAGFGGTPEEIQALASMTPQQAVESLVNYDSIDNTHLQPFVESGLPMDHLAQAQRRVAMIRRRNVVAQAEGPMPTPKVDPQALVYLRQASNLELHRVTLWWADRMLRTGRPLEERMTLFWHDHFACSNQKIKDYRKMLRQNELFREFATGNFGDLLIEIAGDPAMLVYLDNRVNVRRSPNENFARELLELFTMGPGHYTEKDIKEAARAFTGWSLAEDQFVFRRGQHDDDEKTFLGQTGPFNGEDIIAIILQQQTTAEFIAGKIYCHFVRENPSESTRRHLGELLVRNNYELKPLLRTIFLSRDFYGVESQGALVKSPVVFVASTYRKLGLTQLPTIPDFREVTRDMGQDLFYPPNVAGWPEGMEWIDPATLLKRANFVRDLMFIDPQAVQRRERLQNALQRAAALNQMPASETDRLLEPDEARAQELATRAGQTQAGGFLREGRAQAMARVIPVPLIVPEFNITQLIHGQVAREIVDELCTRFLSVQPNEEQRQAMAQFYQEQLIEPGAQEAALRHLLHLILSLPEYHLM